MSARRLGYALREYKITQAKNVHIAENGGYSSCVGGSRML